MTMFVRPPPPHTCSPCPLVHLPEPHECPVKVDCSHTDYKEIKEQLKQQEKIIQTQAERIKELEDKPPLTVVDETTRQNLIHSQQTITKLEKELTEKTIGEKIETIIKIDEKLLNENANLKVELN